MTEPNCEEFVWRTHGYINDYIRLADAKAGALFAIFGALIGVLVHQWAEGDESATWWRIALFASALSSALTVIALAIDVVRPRVDLGNTRVGSRTLGYIYWKHIRARNREEYEHGVRALDKADLIREVTSHTWEIAGIAETKYKKLKYAFLLSYIGLFLCLLGVATL
jgi:hypothetical protein